MAKTDCIEIANAEPEGEGTAANIEYNQEQEVIILISMLLLFCQLPFHIVGGGCLFHFL